MTGLRQRGADGYPVGADAHLRNSCGPIPAAERFQHHTGFRFEKPVEVFGWQWSVTFGRWTVCVRFADGWQGFTWPEPVWHRTITQGEHHNVQIQTQA